MILGPCKVVVEHHNQSLINTVFLLHLYVLFPLTKKWLTCLRHQRGRQNQIMINVKLVAAEILAFNGFGETFYMVTQSIKWSFGFFKSFIVSAQAPTQETCVNSHIFI